MAPWVFYAVRPAAAAPVIMLLLPALLGAQAHPSGHDAPSRRAPLFGAQGVAVVTHATPTITRTPRTEGYLTQPMVSAMVPMVNGRLTLHGTLNFEGVTLRRGELTTGIYGEGYVDRRHPHTYVHELMLSGHARRGQTGASLAVGRGFAPFGTDDPMVRPFVKYPVNHHLAQILERVQVVAALRAGPVTVDAGVFNGDEPVSPGAAPRWNRFGDSWAARVTLRPSPLVELQASRAEVESPELDIGGGFDQRKWSASARAGGQSDDDGRYLLAEWARTDDLVGSGRRFRFTSLLAEGAARWRGTRVALRGERTVRPEEERELDPFRSARPHTDAALIGATRWTTITGMASRALPPVARVRMHPFVEVAWLHAAEENSPSAFVPRDFYGSSRLWSFSAGARIFSGHAHDRMGRYGVAVAPDRSHQAMAPAQATPCILQPVCGVFRLPILVRSPDLPRIP